MKLAVPDLISNSYFPAIVATELGFFEEEGLNVSLERISLTKNVGAFFVRPHVRHQHVQLFEFRLVEAMCEARG